MTVIDRFAKPGSPLGTRLFLLAQRFVAGETIASALEAVRALNAYGLTATLDFLGEDALSLAEADRTRETYLAMLDALDRSSVRSNVSVKLTALGLLLDEERCVANLAAIVERATTLADPFVRIDMEGSAVSEATLRIFARTFALQPNVGCVIQAYLRRSPVDIERAIALGARVRLCKGAYRERKAVALTKMADIRAAYGRMAEALLSRGNYPALATHDGRLIEAAKAYALAHGIASDRFEFQMLYGVRPHLQRQLARDGYNVRIYVPFGTHWAPYFYRRIAERKENALFALRSLVSR